MISGHQKSIEILNTSLKVRLMPQLNFQPDNKKNTRPIREVKNDLICRSSPSTLLVGTLPSSRSSLPQPSPSTDSSCSYNFEMCDEVDNSVQLVEQEFQPLFECKKSLIHCHLLTGNRSLQKYDDNVDCRSLKLMEFMKNECQLYSPYLV